MCEFNVNFWKLQSELHITKHAYNDLSKRLKINGMLVLGKGPDTRKEYIRIKGIPKKADQKPHENNALITFHLVYYQVIQVFWLTNKIWKNDQTINLILNAVGFTFTTQAAIGSKRN